MIQVHIQILCNFCKGQSYLPIGEATSYSGELYIQYKPCPACGGSGHQEKWVELAELAQMLSLVAASNSAQKDWPALAEKELSSQ